MAKSWKYSAYLTELHTKEVNELEQLKTKKRRLQKDAEALEKEADNPAVTAQQKHDFTCITKLQFAKDCKAETD